MAPGCKEESGGRDGGGVEPLLWLLFELFIVSAPDRQRGLKEAGGAFMDEAQDGDAHSAAHTMGEVFSILKKSWQTEE